MAPKTKNFHNARSRVLADEGNSAAPLNNFAIAEKVLGTATGEIFFLPKKAPLLML